MSKLCVQNTTQNLSVPWETSNFGHFLDLKKKIEKTRFFSFAPGKWAKSQKTVKITFSQAVGSKKWSKNSKSLTLHRRFLSKMAIFRLFCIVGQKLTKNDPKNGPLKNLWYRKILVPEIFRIGIQKIPAFDFYCP